ncbi:MULTISPECIES: phage tail tape measure protein [unclassified Methylobacterium]|uniref:phage tail tape measure protein n=1 Tax=unclassified Methylobacterium TaxID=2615210 RepID=UPI0011C1D8A7|nr:MULTISPECIES: phage tail tape measure protein [unclassified Methylobacterium]QEE37930.1 phage tail tape measure protein [Methylobacterium sp. WL1]TXN59364.1 phage tail tape measure protein [Methylobacterium sp. WL2]
MADDLNVDIGIGSNELESDLRRTFDALQAGLRTAQEMQVWFERSAKSARELPTVIRDLNEKLALAKGSAAEVGLQNQIKAAQEQQLKLNNELRTEITIQKELSLARGAGQRATESGTVADGRTVAQVRATERAMADAVTGINTTAEQVAARLAIATGKAMERLIAGTAQQVEQSVQLAANRAMTRNAQLSVPGYLDASVVNARVASEAAVRKAGMGSTLDERDAGRRMYGDAAEENRQRTLQANRIRRDAERENAERDRISTQAVSKLQAEAAYEDAERSRRMSQLQTRAAWDNRNFDQLKKAADAEYRAADAKMRSDAAYEDRQRTLAANRTRRDAERENRDRDNDAKASQTRVRSSADWDNRAYDRETKTAALRERNAAEEENRLRTLAANRMRRDAERENKEIDADARRAAVLKQRADRAEYQRSPAGRQEAAKNSFEARSAAFDLNGGADQFAFQTKLTANYAIMGGIALVVRGATSAVIEFDEQLKQFQAITGTANAEMDGFRKQLLDVASTSKFSVGELTTVAVALGQTGLSASEVGKALKPVVDLAAASGSTLQQSVEAITGVLGAYNLEAGRAGEVADVFVGALNATKLTMDQLQLGIQYAANIARDSGISFSELTASIGAVAQAGVKSGSTIGTGIRQLITEFSEPSDKLRGVLKELNIDLGDVNLRTQGFSGVLKNLKEGGFTTADALRSLDLRASAAFAALAGQSDKIEELQQEFLLSSAAAESASTANESLSATFQRLKNSLFAVVDTGFHPFVTVLTAAIGNLASFASGLTALGPVLPTIASGVAAIAASAAAIKIGSLIGGLTSLGSISALLTGPVGIGAVAIGGIAAFAYWLSKIQDDAAKAAVRLDELKKVTNELTSEQQTLRQTSGSLDTTITGLIDRRAKLNEKGNEVGRQTAIIEAQKAFADLGLVVDSNATSVDGLIEALQKLRGELNQQASGLLTQQLVAITEKMDQLAKLEAAREAKSRVAPAVTAVSEYGTPTIENVDPLERMRALGPEFERAADIMSGKTKIDTTDVRRQTASVSAEMYSTLLNLRRSRTDVDVDNSLSESDRKTMLAGLDAQIEGVQKAIKDFGDKVSSVQQQQAVTVEAERVNRELQVAQLKATPVYAGFENARDNIYRDHDTAVTAAGRSRRGYGGYEAMQDAARSTDDQVRDQLAKVEEAKRAALAEGVDPKVVKEAYDGIIDSFNILLKGTSKEIRERFKTASGDAKADLNQQIRTAQSQMELLQRQGSTATDPDRVTDLQGVAVHNQEIINKAREALFKIDLGPNADQLIANSPELQDKAAELKEKGQADLNKLAVSYAELHRRVQVQMLSFQVDRATERKDLLQEQIKGLEKVRDDARSTPEAMRAAVQEINRLLGEVARIGQGINKLNADKIDTKLPTTLGPTVSFDRGSAQQAIVDQLKASGASEDRIRYALASGQIESGYAPDVLSGARKSSAGAAGLFQFMPKTWQNMYGTRDVDTDITAQIKAFQTFTDRNAGSFRSNMGREATPEELYLMHQQGAAGSMALLRAGSGSALDALTGAYGGNADAARSAITGNGGRADMAADEFIALIQRKFRSAQALVGNPFGTTGKDETDRMRTLADDKTASEAERLKAENERKAQANERVRELAELKRTDKALSETYDTQLEAVRRAQDPAAAMSASKDAFGTLRQLLETAKKEDGNKTGLDDDARAAQGDATRKRFAGLFQQQGLTTAETVGKDSLKAYEDKLNQLKAEQKELERPENEGRAGNTERLNVLRDEINELEKQKELQGTYEANQARIVALEQPLKEMKDAGLDVDRDGVEVQRRILELRERNKVLEPTMNLSRQQAATGKSFGEAASGATDSFLKQRGILDFKGQVVDPVVQAQKTMTESLGVIGGAFDNFFTNLFNGSMKAGDALKSFATSILSGLMSQISKSLTNSIFQSLFTGGTGGGGGILSGIPALFGMYHGGPIRMAGGGGVPGTDAALSMRDSKPILAQPGEYLLRRSAVDAIGRENLDQVNALGGAMVNRAPKVDAGQRFGGASAQSNVYVVDREQVPPPSANDVVHMIGDNIQRGGAIRQLIKSVSARG